MRRVPIAVGARPLLVVAAIEITAPTPFLRRRYQGVGVHGFDFPGVIEEFVADFLHGRANGVHILVGRKPDAVLVIHEVIAHAAVGGQAPAVGQVLHKGLLKQRVGRKTRVIGIIGGDQPGRVCRIVGAYTVAGVGHPLPIGAGLRAVFVRRITGELGSARPQNGRPPDHGNGQHGLRAAAFAGGYEGVGGGRGRGGPVVNAFEVPVRRVIVRVELPVVARLGIAAGSVHRAVHARQVTRSGRKGYAIDQRTDRVAVELRIHGDGDRSVRHRRSAAPNQRYVIHVKSAERRTALALNPDSIQVGLAGDTERRKWNSDLLPRAGGWGEVVWAGRHRAPEGCPHPQRLSSAGTAMNPKGQIGVGG